MPEQSAVIPQHLAIICDGNRRWAKEHGLPPFEGHQRAVNQVFDELIEVAAERGIRYLTFWIFSTENWQRDKLEVEGLMNLFRLFFDKRINEFKKKNIRFKMIGNLDHFAGDIQKRIVDGMEKTKDCDKITVTLAMSYGGRDELIRAVKKIGAEVASGDFALEKIDAQKISASLDTWDLPDPELIVRTSGEQRLSGFMLWQSEYSEFYFPKWHFPEFDEQKLDECLAEFAARKRRFGK